MSELISGSSILFHRWAYLFLYQYHSVFSFCSSVVQFEIWDSSNLPTAVLYCSEFCFCFCFCFCFEKMFLCVTAPSVLGFALYNTLAMSLPRSACFCLPSGIKGMHHCCPAREILFNNPTFGFVLPVFPHEAKNCPLISIKNVHEFNEECVESIHSFCWMDFSLY